MADSPGSGRGVLARRGMFARLRWRTTLLLVGAVLVADAATLAGLSSIHRREVEGTLALATERIERLPEGLPPVRVGLVNALAPSDLYVAFLNEQGQVLTSNPPLSTDDVPDASGLSASGGLPQGEAVNLTTPGGSDYRVLRVDVRTVVRIQAPGGASEVVDSVVVGYPLGSNQQSLHRLLLIELIAALLVLLGWVWISSGFVRAALRPLGRIAETAQAIAAGRASERIDVGDDPSLRPVADALNGAFDARQEAELRMRDFVADASHELRTPLAAVRGWADLYRVGGIENQRDVDSAMQMIFDEAGRMQQLVEDMLLLARLDIRRGSAGPAVALKPILEDIRAVVAPLYPAHHFEQVEATDDVFVQVESDALRRAIGNLLVNGGRHTPDGSTIAISAELVGGLVEIRVQDNGAGLAAEERASAFNRFWRGDHGRVRPGGSGLGLAITQSAFRSFGGDLKLEPATTGGLLCIARLPGQARPDDY